MRNVILIRIGGGMQIIGTPPNAIVGSAYSYTFNIISGIAAYSVTHTSLPAWITFSASGSQITLSGTPAGSDAGSLSFTITVVDAGRNSVFGTYAMQVLALPLSISGHLPNQTSGAAITPYTYTTIGGYGGNSFAITSGALPTGLSINSSTGQVTGTPSANGSYSWDVTVTDSHGAPASVSDSCTVAYATLTMTGTPPGGIVGTAYSFMPTIAGGNGSNNVTVSSGSLPAWASLNSTTGAITGTPSSAESTTFTLHCHSGDGQDAYLSCTITITIVIYGFNPSDKGAEVTLSNSNFTATGSIEAPGDGREVVRSITSHSSGKWVFEITNNSASNSRAYLGLAASNATLLDDGTNGNYALGKNGTAVGFVPNSGVVNASGSAFGIPISSSPIATGETTQFVIDFAIGIWIKATASDTDYIGLGDPVTGSTPTIPIVGSCTLFAACSVCCNTFAPATGKATINTGGSSFASAAPTGFSAWG